MSRDGSIITSWGDEEFTFRLATKEWRRIQERCDAGPGELYRRLIGVATVLEKGMSLAEAAAIGMIGDWRIDDVREPILQGLLGGGMSDLQARALVQQRVDLNADFRVNLALAFAIVKAGLGEVSDERVGEPKGAAGPKGPRSRKARSASQ